MNPQSEPFERRIQALTDRILADYGNKRVQDWCTQKAGIIIGTGNAKDVLHIGHKGMKILKNLQISAILV